jgi:penicillin-binding protein 1C
LRSGNLRSREGHESEALPLDGGSGGGDAAARKPRKILGAVLLFLVIGAAGFIWHRSTFIDPRPTTILADRHGAFLGQIGESGLGYGYWPVEQVPQRVSAAILALEDHRFWDHPGVDPLAVFRAAASNLREARRVSGASTLAMQVARMQHPAARGYVAKSVEMATALAMTARYGREGVLRQYLKLVPLGQNSHGIAHAARWYFDKPVDDLSWAEIAFLSAIPQAPAAMNPNAESGRLRATLRGHRALARLRAQGVLTDEEFAHAEDDIERLTIQSHPTRPADAIHAVLLTEALMDDHPALARARSTIDLALEDRVTKIARQKLDSLRPQGAEQMAVILLDPKTAEVLAMVGSSRYAGTESGMIDYAVRPRSPGSTLKPFIYAQALERGDIAPSTVLVDDPDNGTGIDNADRRFLGPLLPRQALANSRNVPAAKLIRVSGLMQTHWFLGNLGLHDGNRPAERYGLTLAVGGLPTGLDRLVAAYDALANDGVLKPLKWYEGQTLPEPRRVLGEQTAREITAFLSDPMARLPSFARMGSTEYPFPVAVKTGTSQGYRDAWVVAYSQRYLVGVWIGRPDGRPMAGLSGAASAAALAHDILIDLHGAESDGLDDGEFRRPAGLNPVRLCAESGRPDDGHCERVATEFMTPAASANPLQPASMTVAAPVRLRVATPTNRSTFIRNPELPASLSFLPLRLAAGAGLPQVLWYVDGKPLQVADATETVRWPLAPGRHTIQARAPYGDARSNEIEVVVR